MFSEETLYAIALRHCLLIGDFYFKKLISAAGSAKDAWLLSKKNSKTIWYRRQNLREIGKDTYLLFAEKNCNSACRIISKYYYHTGKNSRDCLMNVMMLRLFFIKKVLLAITPILVLWEPEKHHATEKNLLLISFIS